MKTKIKNFLSLKIVLLLLLLTSFKAFAVPPGFVYREGIHFMLDGNRYYFAGANCYDLFTFGDGSNTSTPELIESHFMDKARIDAHMKRMKKDGVDVLRLWAFSHEVWHGFEPSEGVYSEPQFMLFDYIIKSAGKHDIKLIPVFENYWTAYGGIDTRLQWEGLPYGNHKARAAFFTDAGCKEQYKNYITHFITRINHYNGVAYKDDPTIFAWELMNEPRYQDAGDDLASINLRAWVDEMGAHIKALDPNHMLGTGIEGHGKKYQFGGDEGNNFVYIHQSEYIDFSSAHPYTTEHWAAGDRPMTWQETAALYAAWIKDAHVIGKPLYIGEWNYHTSIVDRVDWWGRTFAIIEANDIIGGSSFWWYTDRQVDPIFGIMEGDAELTVFKNHSTAMIAKRDQTPVSPVANFTMQQVSGQLTVNFDAAGSTDSDGVIKEYQWSFGAAGSIVSHTFPAEGTYEITLTVIDNDGLSTSKTKSIDLSLAPKAPTINITSPAAGTAFSEGTSIEIKADAFDQDGTVKKVEFYAADSLIGSDTAYPYQANWIAAGNGDVIIKAIATDNDGLTSAPGKVTLKIKPIAGQIKIKYDVNSWAAGFTANVIITNHSEADIADWVITFDLPGEQKITKMWNAEYEQIGQAARVFTTLDWNKPIKIGESKKLFGFEAAHGGTPAAPTAFYLNGKLLIIE